MFPCTFAWFERFLDSVLIHAYKSHIRRMSSYLTLRFLGVLLAFTDTDAIGGEPHLTGALYLTTERLDYNLKCCVEICTASLERIRKC